VSTSTAAAQGRGARVNGSVALGTAARPRPRVSENIKKTRISDRKSTTVDSWQIHVAEC